MTQTDFCLLSVDRYAGERSLTQNTLKRIMLGYNPHGPKRQAVPYNPTPKIVRGIHTVFDRIRGWENAVDLSLFEVYNHRIQEDSTRRDDEDDLGWYTRTAKLTKRLVDEQAVEQLRLLCKHSLAFAPDYGEAEFFNLAGIAGEFAADDYRNGQKGFVSLPKRKGELIMEMRNTGLSPQEQQALMGKLETIVQTYLQTLL
ncbi:MAG: hypothetical protein H7Y22_05290 [Gemmatimonadaceae bacterium]|nr:hypothetical protein [Gloeobacterales cyanobacterium ES-bin-141]